MAVSIALYIIYFAGAALLLRKNLTAAIGSVRLNMRLKSGGKKKKRLKTAVFLENLMLGSFGFEIGGETMLWILAAVFAGVFIVVSRTFYFFQSLFISLMASLLPLLIMLIRLEDGQSKNSREGLSLVSELARQYRIHGRNIYSAIEYTIDSSAELPISKKHLYRLLLRLREASSPAEIKSAADSFAFVLGTVWGKMLAACIRMSAEKGNDISDGLDDISAQLSLAFKRAEDRKRLNAESARMTIFLVPVLYLGTVLISVKYLGISTGELFRSQFFTPEGLLFFLLTIFLFVINNVLLKAAAGRKLDY